MPRPQPKNREDRTASSTFSGRIGPDPSGGLVLRAPTVGDEAEARRAQAELADDGFDFLLMQDGECWAEWLARIARERAGTGLPAGRVPATFLLAVVGDDLVGRVSVRHELNDFLLAVGGHVGYGVRPGRRRRGHATEILRQSLEMLRGLGLDRALVTCDDDNLGSIGTIEACGGVLEDIRPGDPGEAAKRRYWIDLGPR
ncbi:GNAT family N-acetyltransferase [Ornithinimicrobium cavernae]|uniref:GNAT family N-acetyltransferase n=1 Tax=Ornithinimicrobium cavernae TaxID=2666047 RepID=UPI001EFFD091|nr:GNAT family N-acetyltransferase [Ornithinimicrobium cavernae]